MDGFTMEVDEPFAHSDEIEARESDFPILSNAALKPDEVDWVFKCRLEIERITRLHETFTKIFVIKVAEDTIPHGFARKAMKSTGHIGDIILLALASYTIILVASFLSRLCAVIIVWALVCRIQKRFYRCI